MGRGYAFAMKFNAILLISVLALTSCSTVSALKNDLAVGYDKVAGVFHSPPDPVKEEKKKLPVYDGTCPPVAVRPDLARLVDFHDTAHTSANDKVSEVNIVGVNNVCRIEKEGLLMQIDLTLSGRTGPKARIKPGDKPSFAYPYFVAVTDSQGNVVSKEIFAASLAYGTSQNELAQSETVFQAMPFPDVAQGITYNVVVGFQLTADQLAYNQGNTLSQPASLAQSDMAMPSTVPPPTITPPAKSTSVIPVPVKKPQI